MKSNFYGLGVEYCLLDCPQYHYPETEDDYIKLQELCNNHVLTAEKPKKVPTKPKTENRKKQSR